MEDWWEVVYSRSGEKGIRVAGPFDDFHKACEARKNIVTRFTHDMYFVKWMNLEQADRIEETKKT